MPSDDAGVEIAKFGDAPPEILELEKAERVSMALELRKAGMSYPEISKELGVSADTVRKYVVESLREFRAESAEFVEEAIGVDILRLDEMIAAIWPQVMAGHLGAHDRALKILERRAKMLGLDRPVKTEHSGPDGGPIQIDALLGVALQQVRRLSDDQLREAMDELRDPALWEAPPKVIGPQVQVDDERDPPAP